MDRLLSMRAFRHVAEEGGFRAAARRLGVSPPMVTRFIGDLERWLGTRLVNRTTRSVALTPAGEEFLVRARGILDQVDEASDEVQQDGQRMRGMLRIMATPAAAMHLVVPAMARFRRLHPAVTIDLQVSHSPAASIEQFDMTLLREDTSLEAGVEVRTLCTSEIALWASPEYLRKNGTPGTPEELSAHGMLRLSTRGQRPKPLELVEVRRSTRRVRVDGLPVLTSNHADALIGATLQGLGISEQSSLIMGPYLADGRLRRVLDGWIAAHSVRLQAALPSTRWVPRRVHAFLDFLEADARAAAAIAPLARAA